MEHNVTQKTTDRTMSKHQDLSAIYIVISLDSFTANRRAKVFNHSLAKGGARFSCATGLF